MDDRSESPSFSQAQAQRARLMSATDKLADGQRRLEDSQRIALETEDVGAGILRDLRTQRDTLEHSRDTVRQDARSLHPLAHSGHSQLYEADGSIDRASSTLRKMIRT
jgi:vesicle transport through interaction with t-SNAREs protein 1